MLTIHSLRSIYTGNYSSGNKNEIYHFFRLFEFFPTGFILQSKTPRLSRYMDPVCVKIKSNDKQQDTKLNWITEIQNFGFLPSAWHCHSFIFYFLVMFADVESCSVFWPFQFYFYLTPSNANVSLISLKGLKHDVIFQVI